MFHYKDTWLMKNLPRYKILAYKKLIDDGYLYNVSIDYFQLTNTVTFEYDCDDIKSDLVTKLRNTAMQYQQQKALKG